MGKLTVRGIESLTKPGRYGDGDGLWLQIRQPDEGRKKKDAEPARSWLYRYSWQGRPRAIGLGPYPTVGLADARRLAQDAGRMVLAHKDPIAEKRRAAAEAKAKREAMTFRAVAKLYIGAHETSWRNAKHRAQWTATLDAYAYPVFGDRMVQDVDTGLVMQVITPLWHTKTETAARLLGRIAAVIDYATAMGWRTGENPARWNGHVKNLLPARAKVAVVEHHAALPWAKMGTFMADLENEAGTAALALRFTCLTAARTGEVIGARWSEIDMKAAKWSIPGARMKAGRDHRVPLSDAALAVLRLVEPLRPETGDGFVFPGRKAGAGLSNMSVSAVLRRMKRGDLTVHGFRSTFRDWTRDRTNFPDDMCEAALAHTISDKTKAAYARGDLFERRRKLMDAWATFCATIEAPSHENVVQMHAAAAG